MDRLREASEEAGVLCLAATDPVNLYGGALALPPAFAGCRRAPGALVCLVEGALVIWVEKGGRSAAVDPAVEGATLRRALDGLAGATVRGPPLRLGKVNGLSIGESPLLAALIAAGAEREGSALRIGRGY